MSQLRMIYDAVAYPRPLLPEVPAGFRLRALQPVVDVENYLKLRLESGFSEWTAERVETLLKETLPEGIRVVEHLESGRLVASASAEFVHSGTHRELGILGWVMASEEFRGRGLGRLAVCSAMLYLRDAGYVSAVLSTDDWRLPAINLYLKMGWRPCLVEEDMPGRWQAVCEKLGYDYASMVTFPRGRLYD